MKRNKPNFLIVGAAKSGTTSLYYYLRQHPQIFMPSIKEANFFALNGVNLPLNGLGDLEWYNSSIKSLDKYLELFANVKNEIAVGEASPTYLHSPFAPKKIFEFNPDFRLIVILRNPADRAFSNFIHCRNNGLEKISNFRTALDLEKTRRDEGWFWASYVHAGYYYKQLSLYYSTFPKENIKVILFEDFRDNTIETVEKVYSFLGVDETYLPKTDIIYNTGARPKQKLLEFFLYKPSLLLHLLHHLLPNLLYKLRKISGIRTKINIEDRNYLINLYSEDIRKLEKLLSMDLSSWRKKSKEVI